MPVRVAAEQAGITESRLRAACRRNDVIARDDVVKGRNCKVVNLEQVYEWAGLPSPFAETIEAQPEATQVLVQRLEDVAAQVRQALDRASRAEQQVIFLRNELAQLRASHGRVQEIVDQRSLGAFQAMANVAATTALAPARRRRLRGISWRPSA